MIDINQLDPAHLATISAIVAALVTVLGNAFNLPTRYRALLAIVIGFVFVFTPDILLNKILTALVIGLTASGVYSQVKPSNLLKNVMGNGAGNNNGETQNKLTTLMNHLFSNNSNETNGRNTTTSTETNESNNTSQAGANDSDNTAPSTTASNAKRISARY